MAAMHVISRKKGFPVFRTLGILLGIGLIAWGLARVVKDEPGGCYLLGLGLYCLPGYITGLLNQVVRIVVDDEAIRFLRRNGTDLTIARSAVIDSEPDPKRIRIHYHGLAGICRATLPLRRFSPEDAGCLRAAFSGNAPLQEIGAVVQPSS